MTSATKTQPKSLPEVSAEVDALEARVSQLETNLVSLAKGVTDAYTKLDAKLDTIWVSMDRLRARLNLK